MIRGTEAIVAMAATIERELLRAAERRVILQRAVRDENERDALFDEAAELRRMAEFAGSIVRVAGDMREMQRPLSSREREGIARRRPFRVVGAGA